MPPHVPYVLRGLPSRLWPKCNRLLRLGCPWGAVTLSRWGGWWYMNMRYQEGALNLSSTKLTRPWSPWGSSPSRKNPHGRNGNRTRDLMISSQKIWPLDHEAGVYLTKFLDNFNKSHPYKPSRNSVQWRLSCSEQAEVIKVNDCFSQICESA
jgi:hypothetical protein